jgi:hypothetical protein
VHSRFYAAHGGKPCSCTRLALHTHTARFVVPEFRERGMSDVSRVRCLLVTLDSRGVPIRSSKRVDCAPPTTPGTSSRWCMSRAKVGGGAQSRHFDERKDGTLQPIVGTLPGTATY